MSQQNGHPANGARPERDDLTAVLDRLRAGGPGRWQPHRLILRNFWKFDEQEFYFTHGRLILSGTNGTGKSTVLMTAITLVLDANRHAHRLTPGRENDRNIGYYIVGDPTKRFHYPDGRTSYIALEFYHPGRDEYRTIGLGLHARGYDVGRVKMWGFAITDGRRVGFDFDFYAERDGQKETYAKPHLARVLGDDVPIVDTNTAYQELVNDTLFGFATLEEYQELLTLIQHVRTPGLGEDVEVDGICQILTESLPPMNERYVGRLGAILDEIQIATDSLERITAHREAIGDINKQQSDVKRNLAQRSAAAFREAARKEQEVRSELETIESTLKTRRRELVTTRERLEAARGETTRLKGRIRELQAEDVVRQHERLLQVERELEAARSRQERQTRRCERAREDLEQSQREKQRLLEAWEEARGPILAALTELGAAGEELAWSGLKARAEEAGDRVRGLTLEDTAGAKIAGRLNGPLFREETGAYQKALRDLQAKLREMVQARARHDAAIEEARKRGKERDEARDQLTAAEREVRTARDALQAAWEAWRAAAEELRVAEAVAGRVSSHIAAARSAAEVQRIPRLLEETFDELQRGLYEERSAHRSRQHALEEDARETAEQLEELRQKPFIEPERPEWRDRARARLEEAGIAAAPLYEAADFRPDLPDAERAWVEQALTETGLLDALVVPAGRRGAARRLLASEGLGDVLLEDGPRAPSPNESLLRWLVPASRRLEEAAVRAVLGAVGLAGEGEVRLDPGAGWKLGPLTAELPGALTDTIKPSFIGHAARVARRRREIERLEADLRDLREQIGGVREEIEETEGRIAVLGREREALRHLAELEDLGEALEGLAGARRAWQDADSRAQEADGEVNRVFRDIQQLRRGIRVLWAECPGTGSEPPSPERVTELLDLLSDVERRTREAARDVQAWIEIRKQHARRAEEVSRKEEDVRDAEQDLQTATKSVESYEGSLAGLRERVDAASYEEVMTRLRTAQKRQETLETQIGEDHTAEGRIKENVRERDARHGTVKARLERLAERRAAAEGDLETALTAYPDLEEDLDRFRAGPGGPLRAAEHLLQLRKDRAYEELRDSIDDTLRRASLALGQAYRRHLPDLGDYTPTLDEEKGEVSFRTHDGRVVAPFEMLEIVEADYHDQQKLVRDKDDELFRDFVRKELAGVASLHIREGEQWVAQTNDLLSGVTVVNQRQFRLRWTPRARHDLLGQQAREFARLMRIDPEQRTPAEDQKIIDISRAVLDELRARDRGGELETGFAEAVKEVFDYRQWYQFTVEKQDAEDRDWKDLAREPNSGAEGVLSTLIPLVIAAKARYGAADDDAPLLLGLDEAMEKVDMDGRIKLFALFVQLEFSWIMTSDHLWGVAAGLPGCSTYEFSRIGNTLAPPVLFVWDGTHRFGGAEATLQLGRAARSRQATQESLELS